MLGQPAMRMLALLLLLAPVAALADEPRLTPTILLGLSKQGPEPVSLPLRIGLTGVWGFGHTATFGSLSHTFDLHPGERSSVDHLPGLRLGVSLHIDEDYDNLANRLLPALQVYVLAAARFSSERPNVARLGLGVASPMLMAAGLSAQVLLPNVFEAYVDVVPGGPNRALLTVGFML